MVYMVFVWEISCQPFSFFPFLPGGRIFCRWKRFAFASSAAPATTSRFRSGGMPRRSPTGCWKNGSPSSTAGGGGGRGGGGGPGAPRGGGGGGGGGARS